MTFQSAEDAAAVRFQRFIDENMAHNHIEAKIVRKVIRALKNAGTPIVRIDDREEVTPVSTEREILEVVFNLDECWLLTERGAWVRIILGNEWDAICDYTVSLEDALKPVNDWIDKHN